MLAHRLAEAGRLPDWVLRAGIRAWLRRRLEQSVPQDVELQGDALRRVLRAMDAPPTVRPGPRQDAPPHATPNAFFELVTGRHLALSCGLFERDDAELDDAETAMLERTCARAEIDDGMRILELGCGFGARSLWIAQHYPSSRVTALAGSHGHKAFVDARAKARGLGNVDVVVGDLDAFDTAARFDRVIAVETFERQRDWRALMARVTRWLDSGGKLFLQVVCHRAVPWLCDGEGGPEWLAWPRGARGLMPSADLALRFQQDLRLEQAYRVSGRHYARTAEAWLANLDRRSGEALEVLAGAGDPTPPLLQLRRWRLCFMTLAERFAFRGGNEWLVGQYRFLRP